MKYTDIVDQVSTATGSSKADAKIATDAVFASIKAAISSGEEVPVKDFGTFKPKETAAREGRNPATGEKIQIAASKGVGFKIAKGFKDALNA
ncbi:HU family DNA-binding protein [Roseibium sp. RKSG952]|uniref:HU family DNA-binding protein n=1 Tax=Roseibium sp. RKSG952 TaxID=2529384 RepID=UPI0012BCEE06|nr:HU family DNA-binding protein [Roseibium sp. RKSG952]MTH95525.1 HU family DNA-binding protein [Roseibium sp. RKSG952]